MVASADEDTLHPPEFQRPNDDEDAPVAVSLCKKVGSLLASMLVRYVQQTKGLRFAGLCK